MLVTQCPRCQESVSIPDSLCTSPETISSVQAQCPWCLATLGANDLRAIVPPPLVILGEDAELQSVGATGEEWTNQAEAGNELGMASEVASPVAGNSTGLGTVLGAGVGAAAGLAAATGVASALSDDDSTGTVGDLPDLDFENEDETILVEAGDEAEDFEPIDFGETSSLAAVNESAAGGVEISDLSSNDLEETQLEVPDLGEFAVADVNEVNESAQQDSGVLAPVMMDVTPKPRRKSGGGIKTMLGIGLGGVMALPIVGLILHFLGKPVPVMGDFLESYLPTKNKAVASRVAASTSIDPPVVLDEGPMQGRSLADEMSAEEFNPGGVSQADAAMAEIGMVAPTESAEVHESPVFSLPEESMPGEGNSLPFGQPPMNDLGDDSSLEPSMEPLPANEEIPGEAPAGEASASEAPADEAFPSTASDLFGADSETESPDMETSAADLFGESTKPAPIDDLFGEAADMTPEPSLPSAVTFDVESESKRLAQSVANVSQMQARGPEREAAINDLFEGLSSLAGNASEDSIESARPVLQAIASDMSLVKAFALAAPDWIGKSADERQSDGALVVGKVGGTPENPTILLSNKQELAVSLPNDQGGFPAGIQIGLGKLEGEGSESTISLSMLQGL